MSRIADVRGDLQAESSGWLFVTTCRGRGHIVAAPVQASQLVRLLYPSVVRPSVKPVE